MSRGTLPKNSQKKENSKNIMESKTDILGINFKKLTKEQIQNSICDTLSKKKSITIFTPNPEFALATRKDRQICDVVNSADFLTPDGIGIIIASHILSSPLPERIAGIDIGEFILSCSNEKRLKIFLLGGKQGVAEKAELNISKKFPNLEICGAHHGYFSKSGAENDAVIEEINKTAPDVLFVCFGFPEQEKWIFNNRNKLKSVKIFAGLGGSIDVWAGDLRRAPRLIQKIGLEWLWRVAVQPSRAKIFLHIPLFFGCVFKQKFSNKEAKKTILGKKYERL